MTDQTFELQLQAAYDRLAAEATIEVDPTTLAAVVAHENGRPWIRLARPIGVRPSWFAMGLAGLLLIIGLLGAVAVGGLLVQQLHQFRGVLTPGPDMSVQRDRPVVVALADGRVLIAGGLFIAGIEPGVAEIYDPRTGAVSRLIGDAPSGTGPGLFLPDGRVFAISQDRHNTYLTHVYLMDPASLTSREVSVTGFRGLSTYGSEPGLALLHDGRVLIVAEDPGDGPSRAFLFDPSSEATLETGSLSMPRSHGAITTLNDGRVLVAGGQSSTAPASRYYGRDGLLDDAELYDPTTGQFTAAGTMPSVRGFAASFLLPDGRVLIQHAGDNSTRFGELPHPVALDVFDPVTGAFSGLQSQEWPGPPTVTQLVDGRLLLTGMRLVNIGDRLVGTPWAATYDPTSGKTTEQQPPRAIFPRGAATTDGLVVLAGGYADPPLTSGNPSVPWTDVFR